MLEGGPLKHWSGSTLFYHAMGQDTPVAVKAQAIRDAGYDAIIGDPQKEIAGTPGRPHIMVYDPDQIRSRFAAFDPANQGKGFLLGSGSTDKELSAAVTALNATQGIRAYHGSPYDFDQFDISRSAPAKAHRLTGMGCILRKILRLRSRTKND